MGDMSWGILVGIIASVAAVFSIVYAVKNGKRAEKQDERKDAGTLSRIETLLEGVRDSVAEIKRDVCNHGLQLNDHEKRLTKIETRNEMKGE